MPHRLGQADRITLPFRMFSHRLSMTLMLALSLGLLLFGRAEAYVFDDARAKATEIITPVMDVLSKPLAMLREWAGGFDDYFNVYEENRRLRAENARLREWKTAALRDRQKAARYEALLNVQLDPDITYITGRAIGETGGPYVQTMIVNVGHDAGARVGQAVVDGGGLIGRVVTVGRRSSRVLLISDLNSSIPIVVEPSQYRALMIGGKAWPSLNYSPDEDQSEIKTGDRVVTSGDGGLFPPGLPVGLVVQTGEDSYSVKPFANPARTDYVRLLKYEFPRTIEPPEELPEVPSEGPGAKTRDAPAAPVPAAPVPDATPAPGPPSRDEPPREPEAQRPPAPAGPADAVGGEDAQVGLLEEETPAGEPEQ